MTKEELNEMEQAVDNLINKARAQKEALQDVRKDIMLLHLRIQAAKAEIEKISA